MNTALYLCQHFGSDGHGCKGLRKVQQMLKDSCKITPFDITGVTTLGIAVKDTTTVLYHHCQCNV